MKNRLHKLKLFKLFNDLKPSLLLLLFLLLAGYFADWQLKKIDVAKAANLTYTETFLTTTYKDAVNTTGIWDTALGQANLFGKVWADFAENYIAPENVSNNSGISILSTRTGMPADSSGSPYIGWVDNTPPITNDGLIIRWLPGVGWAKMDGTLGYENITNNVGGTGSFKLKLNSLDEPYASWSDNTIGNYDIYFTKWTPGSGSSVCGVGINDCWTNMAGTIAGGENISNNAGVSGWPTHHFFDIGSNNIPYIVWRDDTPGVDDLFFITWTVGAGPGVCGAGINDCWTNMAGTVAGPENISSSGFVMEHYRIKVDSNNNPYLAWNWRNQEIRFTKWTPSACGGTGCWTKIDNTPGFEDVATGWGATYVPEIEINALDIPFVTWHGNFAVGTDIGITKGIAGVGWQKMDGTPGNENVSVGTTAQSYFQTLRFDSGNNPNLTWDEQLVNVEILFTKWTPGAGAGVCGGPTDCWTNIAESVSGWENISNTPGTSNYAVFELGTDDSPYVIWTDVIGGQKDVLFRKGTPGVGWTNMSGTGTYDNLSNNAGESLGAAITVKPFDIPSVDWVDDVLGNQEIFVARWMPNYKNSSVVQSLNVNSTAPLEFVQSATLTATETLNGQTIDYYLSNDGGATWHAVTNGSLFSFPVNGNDLRWRAVLSTANIAVTPIIDDLAITYQTTKMICSVVPDRVIPGQNVAINATTTFVPTAITAQINNGLVPIINVPLINIGGFDYLATVLTTAAFLGTDNVIISALDPGPPETVTCNSSFIVAGSHSDPRPNAPTDLSCEALANDSIRWNFVDTATNETGFKLYGPDGLIMDTGEEVVTDISYLDETNLDTNVLYPDRYVRAFNGAGESGNSNMASCYTLANRPIAPLQVAVSSDRIVMALAPGDGNPDYTEYAIKDYVTGKFVQADGTFGDTEDWQTYENWGGANGLTIVGDESLKILTSGAYQMALSPSTTYSFAIKARNGDNIETAYSSALSITTSASLTMVSLSISKEITSHNNLGTVNVGDILTYKINIANNSPTPCHNLVVIDPLNSHLQFVAGSAKAKIGAGAETALDILPVDNVLTFNLGNLAGSSSAYVIFSASVMAGSEGLTIYNDAQISANNATTSRTNVITNYVPALPVEPLVTRYACNSTAGTCSVSSTGVYTSLAACQSACQASSVNANINAAPTPLPPVPPSTDTPSVIPPILPPSSPFTPPSIIPPIIPPSSPTLPSSIIRPFVAPLFTIPIIGSAIEKITSPAAAKLATSYVTPVLLTIAAVNTLPTALLLVSYILPYLHLLFVEPFLWLFRRKRKKWGIVYNALSKVPVDLAVVRLFRKSDNSLVQTRVTDKEGRYIFIVKEVGKYYISVAKSGFVFPTRYLADDKQDSKYIDLYHGEAVEVTEKEATITANIPLDPAEKKIIPEREVVFGYLFKNLRIVVSYVGLVLAALIFLVYPSWLIAAAIILHIILFVIFVRLIVPQKPKSWGIVYDQKTKKPLHYAVIRIFDTKFNKLLETQVTDGKGRYSFLVGQNEYQLLAEKEGYQKKEIKPVDLIRKEEIVNLDLPMSKSAN